MSHVTSYTKVVDIKEVNLAEGGIDLDVLKQARNRFLLAQYSIASYDAALDTGAGKFKIGDEDWEVSAVPSQELVLLKRDAAYMLVHTNIILPTYAQATFAIDPQTYDSPLVRPIDEQRIEAIQTLLPWVKAMEPQLEP